MRGCVPMMPAGFLVMLPARTKRRVQVGLPEVSCSGSARPSGFSTATGGPAIADKARLLLEETAPEGSGQWARFIQPTEKAIYTVALPKTAPGSDTFPNTRLV